MLTFAKFIHGETFYLCGGPRSSVPLSFTLMGLPAQEAVPFSVSRLECCVLIEWTEWALPINNTTITVYITMRTNPSLKCTSGGLEQSKVSRNWLKGVAYIWPPFQLISS